VFYRVQTEQVVPTSSAKASSSKQRGRPRRNNNNNNDINTTAAATTTTTPIQATFSDIEMMLQLNKSNVDDDNNDVNVKHEVHENNDDTIGLLYL
jgi:hypothetical protein